MPCMIPVAIIGLTAALAQQDIPPAPEKSMWLADLIAILLVVCVGVVSFMSSKRGHQD